MIRESSPHGVGRKIYGAQITAIGRAIEALDREMRVHIKRHRALGEDVARLETIPGVGMLTAAAIDRAPSCGACARSEGCCPMLG
ncbi:MAG TPA: hypothetical protein VE591_13870 [Candidatus Acidoferrum sp.]|nr:hypothetical protein [Candidatus Acidoferrum sp.]